MNGKSKPGPCVKQHVICTIVSKSGTAWRGENSCLNAQEACAFDKARSTLCVEALRTAVVRGLPQCEDGDGFIYVADKSDARQVEIFEVIA